MIDLSLVLDEGMEPFRGPQGYSDPAPSMEPWVRIGQRVGGFVSPFQVTLLRMGVHTGTHVDAPSHFHAGGSTVTDLPVSALVGRAVVVDVSGHGLATARLLVPFRSRARAHGSLPLLLTPQEGLSPEAVGELVSWGRPLLAFAGPVDGEGGGYEATSALLKAGLWLATNLDVEKGRLVRDGDLMVVAPLPLRGLEGSPCRVLAIRGHPPPG